MDFLKNRVKYPISLEDTVTIPRKWAAPIVGKVSHAFILTTVPPRPAGPKLVTTYWSIVEFGEEEGEEPMWACVFHQGRRKPIVYEISFSEEEALEYIDGHIARHKRHSQKSFLDKIK